MTTSPSSWRIYRSTARTYSSLGLVPMEPVESVELSRSRVRSGRSATRASPARYPRHDSNVHTLGLGQLPLPLGYRGQMVGAPGADPDADG